MEVLGRVCECSSLSSVFVATWSLRQVWLIFFPWFETSVSVQIEMGDCGIGSTCLVGSK
jgi:hypothetical protein